MIIQRLRINGWDVHNCDEIVEFGPPDVAEPYWVFIYKNGDQLTASGAVSFLLKAEGKNFIDTGSTT